jgi:hypothetical protein
MLMRRMSACAQPGLAIEPRVPQNWTRTSASSYAQVLGIPLFIPHFARPSPLRAFHPSTGSARREA